MTPRTRVWQVVCGTLVTELGFLAAAMAPSRWVVTASMVAVALTAGWVCILWARRGWPMGLTPRMPTPLVGRAVLRSWFVLACVCLFARGAWYGWNHPLQSKTWSGRVCVIQATVTGLSGDGPSQHLDLQLNTVDNSERSIQPVGSVLLYGASAREVAAAVSTGLAGPHVTLRGVLLPIHASATPSFGTALMDELLPAYSFSGHVLEVHPADGPMARARAAVANDLARWMTPSAAELTFGVVFGEANPSPALRPSFLAAGLLHVLAASGANVWMLEGVWALALYRCFRRWRWTRILWHLITLVLVWGFAGLCQNTPSITRAAAMSTYRRAALLFHRDADPALALAWSALTICGCHPDTGVSVSFWLSCTATAAVLRAMRGDRRRHPAPRPRHASTVLSRLDHIARAGTRHILSTARVALAVEWAVLPLEVGLFDQWTPYAVVTNIVAEPVLAVLLPAAVVTALASVLCDVVPWLTSPACAMGWLVERISGLLAALAQGVASLPGALQSVNCPPVLWIAGALAWWTGPAWAGPVRRVARRWRATLAYAKPPGIASGRMDEPGAGGTRYR